MSLSEIFAEVDRLSDAERTELVRRLRARELVNDPQYIADVSARLDRALEGRGVIDENELKRRMAERGSSTG